MKAKVHEVTLFGHSFLVMARSRAGAMRDLYDHLRDDIHADVASGQAIYNAGRCGVEILGIDKYANVVDPNQIDLEGLDATDDDNDVP